MRDVSRATCPHREKETVAGGGGSSRRSDEKKERLEQRDGNEDAAIVKVRRCGRRAFLSLRLGGGRRDE